MAELAWTYTVAAQFDVITPEGEADDGQATDRDNFALQITDEGMEGVVLEGQPDEILGFLQMMADGVIEAVGKRLAVRAGDPVE